MGNSFTVDEIREIFENIVKNSNRHGNSYYTQLNGETSTQNVGYFEQCMPCFLEDLQMIADGLYDKNGNKIADKTINDYDNVREALQTISDKYVDSLLLVIDDDELKTIYINISGYIKDMLSNPEKYIYHTGILNHNSYHISYKEENATLFILLHAYKVQGN